MTSDNTTSHACEIVSWHAATRLAYKLAEKINQDDYRPNIVIAIARGGYVPARIICDRLDIYKLASIQISHYKDGSAKQDSACLSIPLPIDIRDMKVLLVDDVDDTGDTLTLALEHLQSLLPKQVKTAVLHHKQVASLVPDYSAMTVRKWRWITYPWALTEDIRGFTARMTPQPQTLYEIRTRLHQQYGIKLSSNMLRGIFPSIPEAC